MTENARYMTPDGKAVELDSWATMKADRSARPPANAFTGGLGYPDPEIYADVDRLNRLSRLCTLQSCAGHRCQPLAHCSLCAGAWRCATCGSNMTDHFYRQHHAYTKADRTEPHDWLPHTDTPHVWSGQLWLWPDRKLAEWFRHYAPELAALPNIEKVSVLWHIEGREIIDIQFLGMGHAQHDGQPHATGTAVLGTSMGLICAFFERGNRECNLS